MNERKNAWVKETVARMRTAEKNDPTSVGAVIVNNEKVIVTITKNIDNPRIGVAMVNDNDEFDLDTGLAIAYTRAMDEELPCFITCDGCDDDYEDDDYYDDDEDEDYDEDDDENYIEFGEISIGSKFIDDGDLYIKVSEDKAYYYNDKKVTDFDEGYVVDSVITD